MDVAKDIRKAMNENKIVIGSDTVLKNLKKGELKSVVYATNCKEDIVKLLSYYKKNFEVEVKRFNGNSRMLGEICGKPFNIMILGIKK